MTDPLARLARWAGIVPSYTDQTGRRRRTGAATRAALLRAMRLPDTRAGAAEWLAEATHHAPRDLPDYAVVPPGRAPRLGLGADAEWQLTLEDGGTREGRGAPLPELPLGLHRLDVGPQVCWLIAAPDRLHLPARDWGVMVPLHALRPADMGGIADYGDLRDAGLSLAGLGAGFVGLNPIHAGFPADPGGFSPYTPSHRRRLSTLHVRTGAAPAPGGPLIDYSASIPAHDAALRAAYSAFRADGGDPAFDAFRANEGDALDRFALHQALSERHGAYWHDWPEALRDPGSDACRAARAELSDSVDFHAWAQWRAQTELAEANDAMRRAGMRHGLYLDLAVGTHPSGAETWEDRESFAYGASLGAPPDAFSASGQAWGIAPFDPRALVAGGFRALAETLRTQLRLSGVLRIDHILGFDRAFWVPGDGSPGAYVQMPRDAMLAVVRLEAARAGAVIVGEDLGNIPRGLRTRLARSGILGCRVQIFETRPDGTFRPPEGYEPAAMASFSTHDLPTWRGWRAGAEIDARHRLGHIDDASARNAHAERAHAVQGFDQMTAHLRGDVARDSADAMHHALAASRSALAMVQVENALDIVDQPNLPGTVAEYPNWRQRLPVAPASLGDAPGLRRAAAIMAAHGRAGVLQPEESEPEKEPR